MPENRTYGFEGRESETSDFFTTIYLSSLRENQQAVRRYWPGPHEVVRSFSRLLVCSNRSRGDTADAYQKA